MNPGARLVIILGLSWVRFMYWVLGAAIFGGLLVMTVLAFGFCGAWATGGFMLHPRAG